MEIADCPWAPEHRLARIGLKGREISRGEHAGSNLVFLIDVSGSMRHTNKLPLLKSALAMLVDELSAGDQVAIVVYAGASGLVLPSTPGSAREEIHAALQRLQAGGRTNGAGQPVNTLVDQLRATLKPVRDPSWLEQCRIRPEPSPLIW